MKFLLIAALLLIPISAGADEKPSIASPETKRLEAQVNDLQSDIRALQAFAAALKQQRDAANDQVAQFAAQAEMARQASASHLTPSR
jgi:outer membrane murein-binding lipoprotein Lpp